MNHTHAMDEAYPSMEQKESGLLIARGKHCGTAGWKKLLSIQCTPFHGTLTLARHASIHLQTLTILAPALETIILVALVKTGIALHIRTPKTVDLDCPSHKHLILHHIHTTCIHAWMRVGPRTASSNVRGIEWQRNSIATTLLPTLFALSMHTPAYLYNSHCLARRVLQRSASRP